MLIASLNKAMRTNYFKAIIDNTWKNNKSRLNIGRHESEFSKLVQMGGKWDLLEIVQELKT